MNLVCFDGWTAGDLIVNLLNKNYTKLVGLTVGTNFTHTYFKLEHLINTCRFDKEFRRKYPESINTDNPNIDLMWDYACEKYNTKYPDLWFGTHFSPYQAPIVHRPLVEQFNNILVIATRSKLSKWYHFLRLCYGQPHHLGVRKETEYRFFFESCISDTWLKSKSDLYSTIEFQDVVSGKFVIDNNLDVTYYEQWKKNNSYLYENDFGELQELFDNCYNEYIQKGSITLSAQHDETFNQFNNTIINWGKDKKL